MASGDYFELFRALVAKGLPDGLWRVILSCSELWWRNGSQMAAGASFYVVLDSGGEEVFQMASGTPFRAILPGGLWRIILS
jgi:hypothetical protein